MGFGVMGWWFGPDSAHLQALEHEVAQLQSRMQPLPLDLPESAGRVPQAQADAPGLREATAAWTWLQQGAQAHGLQVIALQLQPLAWVDGLPEQAVRLRLRGHWRDAVALESALHERAPWWVVDQWQVLPEAGASGEVRIDWQGRMALQPERAGVGLGSERDRALWPVWSAQPLARAPTAAAAPALFAEPSVRALPMPAPAEPTALAPRDRATDPRHWPVRELQLLGVWWQDGAAHAVLGQGLSQVRVVVGQRIGQEAYLVQRITSQGVALRSTTPGEVGARLELTWSGER
jgi:hypothetical protein